MKINVAIVAIVILLNLLGLLSSNFQGKAYYFSKSLELGAWGARMSDPKKQIKSRLKID